MYEYKVIKESGIKQAEKAMNKYAKEGWRVVSSNYYDPNPEASYYDREEWFFITLERVVEK